MKGCDFMTNCNSKCLCVAIIAALVSIILTSLFVTALTTTLIAITPYLFALGVIVTVLALALLIICIASRNLGFSAAYNICNCICAFARCLIYSGIILVLATIILNLVTLTNMIVAGVIIFFVLAAAILILFSVIGLSECLIKSACNRCYDED